MRYENGCEDDGNDEKVSAGDENLRMDTADHPMSLRLRESDGEARYDSENLIGLKDDVQFIREAAVSDSGL